VILPVILSFGFDPIWFGVIVVVAVELAVITPPVGINVFVINSVTPDISLPTIFRGTAPFVVAGLVCLLIFVLFPDLALFLPSLM
jgi:TRAP-type C4-dicarboxylate transport system permease large subunit